MPLRDVPLSARFIRSKLFKYFRAGKAVVGSARGEPAAILREGGAVVVDPEDGAALADAVRHLAVADMALVVVAVGYLVLPRTLARRDQPTMARPRVAATIAEDAYANRGISRAGGVGVP